MACHVACSSAPTRPCRATVAYAAAVKGPAGPDGEQLAETPVNAWAGATGTRSPSEPREYLASVRSSCEMSILAVALKPRQMLPSCSRALIVSLSDAAESIRALMVLLHERRA